MSVECPADGCGYSGTLDAVEGHIGGSADSLHEGVVVPDLGSMLPGEGDGEGDGEAPEIPLWALVVGALLVLYLVYRVSQEGDDQPEQPDQQEQQDEIDTVEGDWSA